MHVLALTGLHGAGKGVLTNELTTRHDFVVSSFSSTAKTFALRYDPYIIEGGAHLSQIVERDGWNAAKSIPRVRSFLNDLGTSLGAVDPDYVLRVARDAVSSARAAGRSIVFDDCYTQAEGSFIREVGGVIVHVEPVYDLAAVLSTDAFQNNLPTPDLSVTNPGTEGSLRDVADEIVAYLDTRRTGAS